MLKKCLFLILGMGVFFIIGCGHVQLGTYTHERVDLDMEGNKGYLTGDAPAGPSTLDRPDRKVLQLEVDLPGPEGEDYEVTGERDITEPVYQPQITPKKESTPKIK